MLTAMYETMTTITPATMPIGTSRLGRRATPATKEPCCHPPKENSTKRIDPAIASRNEIDVVPSYQTILPDTGKEALEAKLREGSVDVITFTSTSTVKNFMAVIGENLKPALKKVAIACIGPITAQTAIDLGLKVDIIPKEYTIESLTQALEDHFEKQRAY